MPGVPLFPGGGRYHRLASALRERFGQRVHKVTLRAGFGCPNRDGRIGTGGCTFCSPEALVPSRGPARGPIADQLAAGLEMIERRYGARAAVAYFQEGSATDAPLDRLEALYRAALTDPRVVALSVGTRPDCLPDDVLDLLAGLAADRPVWLELGLQTADEALLARLNRGHGLAAFEAAAGRALAAGLEVVAHVILDLPGETADQREATAAALNRTRVAGVKIHNLHVLRGTPLADELRAGRLALSSLEAYADRAADFLARLDQGIAIHRLSGEGPEHLMLAPDWGREKARIRAAVEASLEAADDWQGKRLAPS